jgi:hypothetical protein
MCWADSFLAGPTASFAHLPGHNRAPIIGARPSATRGRPSSTQAIDTLDPHIRPGHRAVLFSLQRFQLRPPRQVAFLAHAVTTNSRCRGNRELVLWELEDKSPVPLLSLARELSLSPQLCGEGKHNLAAAIDAEVDISQ